MRRCTWSLFLVLGLAACGGEVDGNPGGDDDPGGADAGDDDSSCALGSTARAVVMSINGDEDAIDVLSLRGGQLSPDAVRFTGVVNPRDVAIRADGAEALVSFGGFGGAAYGVVVLDLTDGGASATVRQTVEAGVDMNPFGLAYASDDHAVLAVAGGPSGHLLVALDRGVDGDFDAGATAAVPDDWPLVVRGRPGHEEVVLARAYLSEDTATDLYRLQSGVMGWSPSGAAAAIEGAPLDVAVAPDGDSVFAATGDPADPIAVDNLDGGGLLHATPLGDDGFGTTSTVALPGQGSTVAVDPGGRFVITDSPIFELDPVSGTPSTYTRRLVTIARDGGALGAVTVQSEPWQALLIHGLEVAATGHVLVARHLYPDQAPAGEEFPFQVLRPTGDGDFETCATRMLDGQGRFAIAP